MDVLCMIPVNPEDRPLGSEGIEYVPNPEMFHMSCEKCNVVCWCGPKLLDFKFTSPETPLLCMNCVFKSQEQ